MKQSDVVTTSLFVFRDIFVSRRFGVAWVSSTVYVWADFARFDTPCGHSAYEIGKCQQNLITFHSNGPFGKQRRADFKIFVDDFLQIVRHDGFYQKIVRPGFEGFVDEGLLLISR